jgi:hypothetical protein
MWNYRVVKTKDEETQTEWLEICEVYYDTLGKPMGYCGATVGGDNVEEIRTTLEMMSKALDKAVIKFNKEPDENTKSRL